MPSRTLSSFDQLVVRSSTFMAAGFARRFDDLNDNTLATWGVVGSVAVDATRGPGVWTFPNTNFTLLINGSPVVANPAATPWHLAGRFKLVTAAAANEVKGVSLGEGSVTSQLHVGLKQAISATKFVFSVTKASAVVSALSTVSLDTTAFHIGELWFDGTSVYGSVDNETPVLVTTAANVPIVVLFERHGTETAAGGADGLLIDYVYFAAGRTAA